MQAHISVSSALTLAHVSSWGSCSPSEHVTMMTTTLQWELWSRVSYLATATSLWSRRMSLSLSLSLLLIFHMLRSSQHSHLSVTQLLYRLAVVLVVFCSTQRVLVSMAAPNSRAITRHSRLRRASMAIGMKRNYMLRASAGLVPSWHSHRLMVRPSSSKFMTSSRALHFAASLLRGHGPLRTCHWTSSLSASVLRTSGRRSGLFSALSCGMISLRATARRPSRLNSSITRRRPRSPRSSVR